MPISNPLNSLFGQSPIKPMQEHMRKALSAAQLLVPFFEAAVAGDWTRAADIRQQIAALENEADDLKKHIRLRLPKSLFLPVPRTDLLELLTTQDKVANRAKDIAGLMLGRQMVIPAEMAQDFLEYVTSAIDACQHAQTAIHELDELVEVGFAGRELALVESLIQRLDEAENKSDTLQIAVRARLFGLERNLFPVDVMFLYQIIDWIGDLADRAHGVGSKLQLLLAR